MFVAATQPLLSMKIQRYENTKPTSNKHNAHHSAEMEHICTVMTALCIVRLIDFAQTHVHVLATIDVLRGAGDPGVTE